MKWYIEFLIVFGILWLLFFIQRYSATGNLYYSILLGIPQSIVVSIFATLGWEEGKKWNEKRKKEKVQKNSEK